MGFEMLTYQEADRVAVIKLPAPVQQSSELALLGAELAECCAGFRANPEARVLVVLGGGKDSFAMEGVLLGAGPSIAGPAFLTEALASVERPVLAAIGGDALGLGLELALACDLRIAADQSRFAMPQVSRGVMTWEGGSQRLPRMVGRAKALEMLLTGDAMDAAEALRMGLVSRLHPADEVEPAALELARAMAQKSPISMEYCKEAVSKGMDLTLEQGLRLEADLYFLMHSTSDRQEGIEAFKEKRTPEFKGG